MITETRAKQIADLISSVGEVEALKQLGVTAETLSRYMRYIRKVVDFVDDPLEVNAKILLFDIETAPTKAYVWGRWKENISQDKVISEGYVLCYAAKWLNDKDTTVDALPFYKGYNAGSEDDREVCSSLYELMNKADIVLAHNAVRFDVPLMKTRFLLHGFNPPKPFKIIDTLAMAKSEFRFPSNSLDSLGAYLGIGRKISHEGFKLWTGCMSGDSDAWEKMMEYNIGDVDLMEKVYLKLRAWYRQHPAIDIYSKSGVMRCKACSSTNLTEDDLVYTNISGFTSYKCNDCGHWNRGRINQRSKEQMKNTLMNVL